MNLKLFNLKKQNYDTSESKLRREFESYGKIKSVSFLIGSRKIHRKYNLLRFLAISD
jgi:RNA recognition motif-containing protein